MSKGRNTPGVAALADVLSNGVKGELPTSTTLDFGVIEGDGSLKCNGFGAAIPSGSYAVCLGLSVEVGTHVVVGWIGSNAVVLGLVGSTE